MSSAATQPMRAPVAHQAAQNLSRLMRLASCLRDARTQGVERPLIGLCRAPALRGVRYGVDRAARKVKS